MWWMNTLAAWFAVRAWEDEAYWRSEESNNDPLVIAFWSLPEYRNDYYIEKYHD